MRNKAQEEIGGKEETDITVLPKKKIDATGLAYYGSSFTGYMKVGVLQGHLAEFKDFYYAMKIEDPKNGLLKIVNDFNEMIHPDLFHPYTNQLRHWTRKWDRDILEQQGMTTTDVIVKKHIPQVIQTKDETGMVVPSDETLEAGMKNLGGELLNDAFTMLKEDQDLEELYSSDELMRRRSYILNVMTHVTKMVHKKQELMLKANAEKRETANFLINILRQATAGKVSSDDLTLLKGTQQTNERLLPNES